MFIYRLEKIAFGDPSDIINNISNDGNLKNIQNDNDISVSDNANNDSIEEIEISNEYSKKAAWVDEDDIKYSYVTKFNNNNNNNNNNKYESFKKRFVFFLAYKMLQKFKIVK